MPVFAVRYAAEDNVDQVVRLSTRVQDALTTSGSLQQIGPLATEVVYEAVKNQHCLIAEYTEHVPEIDVVACALVHPIKEGFYSTVTGFDIARFPSPWLYMHGIMLEPSYQGFGLGSGIVKETLEKLRDDSRYANGTAFLGCWVGSGHLRRFYERIGFELACIVPKEDYEVAVYSIPLSR